MKDHRKTAEEEIDNAKQYFDTEKHKGQSKSMVLDLKGIQYKRDKKVESAMKKYASSLKDIKKTFKKMIKVFPKYFNDFSKLQVRSHKNDQTNNPKPPKKKMLQQMPEILVKLIKKSIKNDNIKDLMTIVSEQLNNSMGCNSDKESHSSHEHCPEFHRPDCGDRRIKDHDCVHEKASICSVDDHEQDFSSCDNTCSSSQVSLKNKKPPSV